MREAITVPAGVRITSRSPGGGPAVASDAPLSRRRLLTAAGVLLPLLLAVAVRLPGLPGGGPVANDEGWAVSNGRFLVTILTHPARWSTLLGLFTPGLTQGRHHVFPLGNDWKPGHDLALGALSAAGVSPENLTWYSALAGVAMVVLVAALAWKRWGPPAAAVAGVFAGSLPLSVAYGHRLLAEADGMAAIAVMLFVLDRWWTQRPSRRLVMFTLLAFLAASTLSYRFLPAFLPIFIVLGGLGWWYRRRAAPPRAPAGRLILVCLLPALAIGTLYLLVAAAHTLGLPHLPGVLRYWVVRSNAGATVLFPTPDFYIRTFWDFGGPVFVGVGVLAFLAVVWNWKKLDYLAAIAVGSLAGTLVFFGNAQDKAPRAIAICIPFAALLVARAVMLWRNKGLQWLIGLAVCGVCLASGWAGSTDARDVSGTAQAGRWLASHPGPIAAYRPANYLVFVTREPDAITVVLTDLKGEITPAAGPAHRIVVPLGDLSLATLRQDGVRWAVVDADALYYGGPAFKQLVACGRAAAEFPDVAGWSRLEFLEIADSLHLTYDAVLAMRTEALAVSQGRQTIRIYDLDGLGTGDCAR
jgi:hypothetical protein